MTPEDEARATDLKIPGIAALPPDVREEVLKARYEARTRPYTPPTKAALERFIRLMEEDGWYDDPPLTR